MKCIVVTPEATILDVEADAVVIPLYDGEIGIWNGHTPLVGRLGYGELRISRDKETTSYYIESGFVEVLNNTISLLTNRAVPSGSLNLEDSRDELESALSKMAISDDQHNLKMENIAAARAQVRLAEKFAVKR